MEKTTKKSKASAPISEPIVSRKGRITKRGVEVVYIGASIERALAEKIDVIAARENLTFSQVIARTLEKEFGE